MLRLEFLHFFPPPQKKKKHLLAGVPLCVYVRLTILANVPTKTDQTVQTVQTVQLIQTVQTWHSGFKPTSNSFFHGG